MNGDDKNDFEKELEQLRRETEQKDTNHLFTQLTQQQQWGIGIAVFIMAGIVGALMAPEIATTAAALFSLGGVVLTWLAITETGVAFRRQLENMDTNTQSQQQQIEKSNQSSKRTCQNCGWQNRKQNNFCHDCGNELD